MQTAPLNPARPVRQTDFKVLGAISFSHFLNDTIQSLMLAIYPLFKSGLGLSFAQIGLITLAFQCTASLLQPIVGFYTDRRPKPFSLAVGMGCTLIGLLTLSQASTFPTVLLAAALVARIKVLTRMGKCPPQPKMKSWTIVGTPHRQP